jgi:hypothetical protein
MKRFAAGAVIGLMLGGALPVLADWGYGDASILRDIREELSGIRTALNRLVDLTPAPPPPTPIPPGVCGAPTRNGRYTGLRPCK